MEAFLLMSLVANKRSACLLIMLLVAMWSFEELIPSPNNIAKNTHFGVKHK